MSNITDEILFNNYALDTDSDYRYLPKGSSPFALNILKAEDGSGGIITNLKGNRKVTYIPPEAYPWLNANVYFVLSSCYDPLTRNVYYWIFSQPVDTTGSGDYEYDNRLLRFNEDTEALDTIFVDSYNYFGLDPLTPFRDSFILGDWLYFNPRKSEPKMIHIEMAYNYTNYNKYDSTATYVYGQKVTYFGGLFMAIDDVAVAETPVTTTAKWDRIGDSYQDETDLSFESEFDYAFNVIKQPPTTDPSFAYGSDIEVASNSVRGKMFRFAYRYKYFDDSYSVYSSYSNVTLPIDDEVWNGEISEDTSSNNYIAVTISLHSPALIKEAEIVFQEIGDTESWKRCKVINRREQEELTAVNFTYDFYNNEAYIVVPLEMVLKAYDSVPRTAQTTEIIHKNILCYGQCLEGFANIPKDEIDVTLTPRLEGIEIGYPVNTLRVDHVADDYITQEHEATDPLMIGSYYSIINVSTWFAGAGLQNGDVYNVVVNGYEWTRTLDNADIATAEDLAAAMVEAILNFPSTVNTDGGVVSVYVEAPFRYPEITVSRIYEPTALQSALSKRSGFKTGAFHPFCLFYYDDSFRRWDSQTSKDSLHGIGLEMLGTTVYVPMLNEYSPSPGTTANRWVVDWTIDHLPPEGAKYYRWGYAGNSLCTSFIQYIIEGITTPSDIDDTIAIDITPLQTLKFTDTEGRHPMPHSNIDPYEWSKGDRVRFITELNDPGSDTELGLLIDGVYDFEILSYNAETYTIYTQVFDYAGLSIGENSLIEIYHPRKNVADTHEDFYEFGELLPIILDSEGVYVHGGTTTNQDTGTATEASGTFSSGDVYHILRTPSKPINTVAYETAAFHESQWYSDFYDSDDFNRGKPGYETSYGERELNIIRFSNTYLQNTQINGLTTFEGLNYKELNDTYGQIMGMEEVGDTLKVYQERKPSSIQLGRIERTDEAGRLFVSASADILGSIRYSTTNYGTEFRESISKNNRYVYGFDIYNGVMWRDSANGIFPISGRYESVDGGGDYKMETYFKAKAKALLESGKENCSVLTVWDERHKNLYVIFKDNVNADNDEAIMFHEPSNKWICFTDMSYTPEGGWNQILELDYWVLSGFEDGIGFEFDNDSRFAIFDIETGGGIETYEDGTFIVDEDGTTYIITESNEYVIE